MKDIWNRTRQAREALGIGAREIPALFKAKGIEITEEAYYKYETRSPLKQHLIMPFCEIAGVNPIWLLTGEGEMRADVALTKEQEVLNYLREKSAEYAEDPFKSPFLKGAIKIIEDESEGK